MFRFPTQAIAKAVVVISACLLLIFSCHPAKAQSASPSPTPESEELKALKERNAILEQEAKAAGFEKDVAEAKKKEAEAKFPKPNSSPLEGKTTINDGAVIESQMISYVSMARAANILISQLKTASVTDSTGNTAAIKIKNLAIYNERDINLLLSYKVALNQLSLIQMEYDDVLKKPGGSSASFTLPTTIASSFLGSFVDLTALLRTNVDIKGQTFDIDESSLVAEVFRSARGDDGLRYVVSGKKTLVNLYYPATFPPDIDPNKNSAILTILQKLFLTKSTVAALINALETNTKKVDETEGKIKTAKAKLVEIASKRKEAVVEYKRLRRIYGLRPPAEVRERIEKLFDDLKALTDEETETNTAAGKLNTSLQELKTAGAALRAKLSDHLQDPSQLEDTVTQLKALNDQFTKFVEALVKASDATATNPLTGYIKAESLTRTMEGTDSYWLQLKVVKAGGNNRIKTNLVVDVFRGGNRISHSGGAIVQYNLYDTTGKSLASDTLTSYSGYLKTNQVNKLPNP